MTADDLDLRLHALDALVHADPKQAILECQQILAADPDVRASRRAWAIIGRSLYELGDMSRATAAIRRGLPPIDAELEDQDVIAVRISAAAIFAEAGDLDLALSQLERAETSATGATVGRVRSQRSLVLAHAGRLVDALDQARSAEASMIVERADLDLMRLLVNRSLIELQFGDLGAAEVDLARAERLAMDLGQSVAEALIVANQGVLHARAGRTIAALAHFDRAHAMYVAAGSPMRTMSILEADRAEALLRAGLHDDAIAAAMVAVTHAVSGGNRVSRGDAELLLARSLLAGGRHRDAQRTAAAAATMLRAGQRRGMALQARAIGLQAGLFGAATEREALGLFARARRLGDRLESAGWNEMSDDLRCARLRAASRLGLLDEVADEIETLRHLVRSSRPSVALRSWYAETLARSHRGDRVGAMRAARSGLAALERFRGQVDDLQIRVGLSAVGEDLAALAVHLAVQGGSASSVFTWAERTRALAYAAPLPQRFIEPARPLRRVQAALAGATLVEYVLDGGDLHAVVITRSRTRLVALGRWSDIRAAADRQSAWLDRAVNAPRSVRVATARSVSAALDALLIAPLRLVAGGAVILIPAAELHVVAWSALPGLLGCAVSLHLSGRGWWHATHDQPSDEISTARLLVGPAITAARAERRGFRRLFPESTIVAGRAATASALRSALLRDGLVQIAAHGTFRSDSPLRSTLRLADGEMPVYTLNDHLVRTRLVMVSSCEGGLHGVSAGGELLGLVAILLARGAETVVAPVHIIPDRECAEFMGEVHGHLADGRSIADAMARVRAAWLASNSAPKWVTAASFGCFGLGSLAVRSVGGVSDGPS